MHVNTEMHRDWMASTGKTTRAASIKCQSSVTVVTGKSVGIYFLYKGKSEKYRQNVLVHYPAET